MESPYFVLYKLSNNEIFYWRELEHTKTSATIYKGKVGELGETVVFQNKLFSSLRKKYKKELSNIISNGYRELEEKDYKYVNVTFDLKSNDYDVNNEQYLETKKFIENILLNTGLGFTIFDEFEIYNDGTLDITCQVVNQNITIDVFEKMLKNSKFSNYKKIYENDFR